MRKVLLTRRESSDEGTFGELLTDTGFSCFTAELPWRDNDRGRSCIPPGVYRCTYRNSPRLRRKVYWLEDVPRRTAIQIHAANFVGDRAKGFRCEVNGCIAPGLEIARVAGQRSVCQSQTALRLLEENLGREPFELTILPPLTHLKKQ